ncbi:hypothetical protein NKR19_g3429 [Coniochaeta hoffmannii]|uniref:Uncharacterized protein n=1 Tax=Coniochaeta hoffmannii TaxID=91930 RepID=A0AA38S8U0_9PEZI|nr:hypothetical protein NKR19_g3429 [Coniochaeta hoffmannii]
MSQPPPEPTNMAPPPPPPPIAQPPRVRRSRSAGAADVGGKMVLAPRAAPPAPLPHDFQIPPPRVHHTVERDPEMERLAKDLIREVAGSKGRIKNLWVEVKTSFWRISRSQYRNPRSDDVNNNIRRFPAFAKRRFTDAEREDILSVVYQNAHRNLDARESQALETLAANASMRRWDLYLWLGERVCATQGTVRT